MQILKREKKHTTPKKIAIVSDAVYPYNKGGKEKRIYDITTRLAREGYDVTIYCMKWWEGKKVIVRDGVTFYAISPYYQLYFNNRRSIREALLFALHCLKLLTKDFDVIDVDHIPHLALFSTKIVCLLKRKKMMATWHEVWGKEYWKKYLGRFQGTIAYIIEKWSVRLPNAIISVSPHTTRDLRNVLHSKKEIVTIPNGLSMDVIQKSVPSLVTSDIIFVGRLLSHKNVDVLLRAIKILKEKKPDITTCIIGEGPEKESLQQLAGELGITNNVTFLDFVEKDTDLYGLMKASKVFAFPSTREGFGVILIEANACGLPVVTVDHPQNAAQELIIGNENGRVCPLEEQQIANSIESALNTKKDSVVYSSYSEKYDWDHLISKVEIMYGLKNTYMPLEDPHNYPFDASIVVLTYNGVATIKSLLDVVFKQQGKKFEVICVDSSSTDGTIDILKQYPMRVASITSEEFGHGKTRNYGAQLAKGKFVVFVTQDVLPQSEYWLNELLAEFDSAHVAGVYGRQVPRPDEKPLDKYFQLSLYGKKKIVWTKDSYRQGDNIFSDANSAVRKKLITENPYLNTIIVSEDYEWAGRMLNMGYTLVYNPQASVFHSHSYTIRQLFKRNFDIGVSFLSIYKKRSSGGFIKKGLKVISREMKYLYDAGYMFLIPIAIFRDAVRYIAIQVGKHERFFTKKFKRDHLSAQKWYWK